MQKVVRQLPVLLSVVSCGLMGPALAFVFLLGRKRRARARRRSSIPGPRSPRYARSR